VGKCTACLSVLKSILFVAKFASDSRGSLAYTVDWRIDAYNINSQLDATITNFIDNYNQLNMFPAIISPILRSTRRCLQLVV